eukprot:4178393-Pyramimonas_sp.AAC.1
MWDRRLDPLEAARVAVSLGWDQLRRLSGLKAYYPFEEGAGDAVHELYGVFPPGALFGNPIWEEDEGGTPGGFRGGVR